MSATPSSRVPAIRLILPACLFFSGFCALAYQVSWARYLTKFLGATAPAYTIVLATFMGGLALGAFLFGRASDRTERPLRLYGLLELMVAGFCFLFPLVMDVLGPLYLALAQPIADVALPRQALRAFMAVAVLAVPSVLMGGTLPAATRFYVRNLNQVGAGVGRLYFVNAFGAVAGTLAAGFFLIPWLGLHGTFWLAAALNAAIGARALLVSRVIDGASACPSAGWVEEVETDLEPPPETSPFPAWVAMAALLATAASGAASMIYEVSWIRLLTLVLGGSTYAFTIMLAAVILGIALGSALVASVRPLARGGLGVFGAFEIAVAFIVLAMVPLYNRLSYVYVTLVAGVPREPEAYPQFLFVGFVLAVSVMLVPTILLGATFPLAARLAARSMGTLGGGVGRAYAFNTAGTLAGTIVAAHLLFPRLGLHGTFAFAASLNMAAGVFCLGGAALMRLRGADGMRLGRPAFAGALVGLAALTGGFGLLLHGGPKLDRQVMARGMFRSVASGFSDFAQFRSWLTSSTEILYFKDGAEDTVAVLDHRDHLTLQVNGKTDASSVGDMPTQMCVGHLPMLAHPSPERALLVGLGSGATSAAILAHPDVELTTVELSPQVVEAAAYFAPFTRDVLHHPRMDLVVEDAKAYLGLSRERFDVIVSEPSNPWVAGNANLFTLEFFELMRSRLAPGGVVAQWFHDYEMTDETVRTILRTFTEAFSYARLFHCGTGRDFALIGAQEPLVYDLRGIRAAIERSPLVREDLEVHLSIRTPLGLFTRNVLDDAGVRALAEGGRLHTDRRPILDFSAPRGVFLRSMSDLVREADQRWLDPGEADILITRATGGAPLGDDSEFEEAVDNIASPFDRLRENLIRQWVDATGSLAAQRSLASEMLDRDLNRQARDTYRLIAKIEGAADRDLFELARLEAVEASAEHRAEEAEAWFDEAEALAASLADATVWSLLAEAHTAAGRASSSAAAWESALALTAPDAIWERMDRLVALARAHREAGDFERAEATILTARALRPDHWTLERELKKLRERQTGS